MDLMTPEAARQFRQAHDDDARRLSRASKRDLEKIAAGFRERIYGQSSKDELISEILRHRYTPAKLNEAIHVLHHQPGEVWSACELCAGLAAALAPAMERLADELAARVVAEVSR